VLAETARGQGLNGIPHLIEERAEADRIHATARGFLVSVGQNGGHRFSQRGFLRTLCLLGFGHGPFPMPLFGVCVAFGGFRFAGELLGG